LLIVAVGVAVAAIAAVRLTSSDSTKPPGPAVDAGRWAAVAAELLANGDREGAERAFAAVRARATPRVAAALHGVADWSRDGTRVVTQAGGMLLVFSVGDFREVARLDAGAAVDFTLSPDGQLLELCHSDSYGDESARIDLVRVATGEVIRSIPRARCSTARAWSSDGKLFAAPTWPRDPPDGGVPCDEVVVWDLDAGSPRRTLHAQGEEACFGVDFLAFDDGAARLRTAEREGGERAWSLATGEIVASRDGHLEIGPAGIGVQVQLRRHSDGPVRRVDARTSADLGELSDPRCPTARGSLFGPTGAELATFDDRHVCLWDPRQGTLRGTIDVERRPELDELRFTPSGAALVIGVAGEAGTNVEHARSYSTKDGALVEDFGTVSYLGPSGDALLFLDQRSHELLRIRKDAAAERTSFAGRRGRFVLPAKRRPAGAATQPWLPETRASKVHATEAGLAVLDGATGGLVQLPAEAGAWSVEMSPDLRWMIGFDEHGHARMWDLVGRRVVRADEESPGAYVDDLRLTGEALTFTSILDEVRLDLASATLQRTHPNPAEAPPKKTDPLRVTVTANGKDIALHPAPLAPTFVWMPGAKLDPGVSRIQMAVLATAVSEDGRAAAAIFAHGDGVVDNNWSCEVRTFELPSGRETRRFPSQPRIYALEFYDGGRLLLGTGHDDGGGAWLWETKTGKLLFKHEMNVKDAKLLVPQDRLVLLGMQGAVEVWDVKNKRRSTDPLDGVKHADVSADGRLIAATGHGSVRVLSIDGEVVTSFATPLGDPAGVVFAAGPKDALAFWKQGAVELVRASDGSRRVSLRFDQDAALAVAGGRVELFGDEGRASRLGRCFVDGFDFPLTWCLEEHRQSGLLAAILR
jgi:WD40 repeat protein